jgi:prepilin-type N-terminal cleavage/methylation domain-containing protein
VKVARLKSGFTLIELLVVISILGILAALTVPALKNLGKSNANISAARQLLDGVGRARQLAMANRTTVYMVFVQTNFWGALTGTNLTSTAATNLIDKQLNGYTFVSQGRLGDQPGRHAWHYIEPWQALPDGSIIAAQKFLLSGDPLLPINIPQWSGTTITNFARVSIPFPTETSTGVLMPCIAFDYSGKLISEVDAAGNYHDAYIPLAQGTVSYALDPATKTPVIPATASANAASEMPPGNSGIGNNNLSYNIIHIDALTGRAVLEFYKMK